MLLRLDGWPLGPATSLVLLGAAFAVALAVAGGLVVGNPRRGRPPSGEIAEELARSARLRRYLRPRPAAPARGRPVGASGGWRASLCQCQSKP